MNLTEIEKVAVLLIALGPKRAQRILDQLSTTDLLPIIAAIKPMEKISPKVRQKVLEEVKQILTDQTTKRPSTQKRNFQTSLLDQLGPYIPNQIDWTTTESDLGPTLSDPTHPDRPPEEDL